MNQRAKHIYQFGPFRLDVAERLLWRDDEPVPLTPKVFDTLVLLVESKGHLLEKDELMRRLWPGTFVEEATLARDISRLRRALDGAGNGQQLIETVPKRGYRFVVGVREQIVSPPKQPVANSLMRSIAVLPFRPLSADGHEPYLELGMADSLITRLSGISQIVVRPTSTVRKYMDPGKDPIAAGRELKVDAVLEGSIQRLDERIRVTVRLVRIRDAKPLWADQFDGKFTNIFALEDSISERVAGALTLDLTGGERKLLTKRHTESSTAYQAYLKGRYFWNRRSAEGYRKAIRYFQQAIEEDPGYALAYAGLADSYLLIGGYGVAAQKDTIPQAKAAAKKALELDDTLAEAHTSLALIAENYDYDWSEAEREFKRAVRLNPNYATARHWYAEYWAMLGRFDKAIAEIQQAQELDPLSPIINTDAGGIFCYARQFDRAIEQYRKALEVDPNFVPAHVWLARANEQKGMLEEAITDLQEVRQLDDTLWVLSQLGRVYALAGKNGEARKVLDELKLVSQRRHLDPLIIAAIYAGLGENDATFAWLEKGYEERSPKLTTLKVNPAYDPLRSDPRFADLLRRVGLL